VVYVASNSHRIASMGSLERNSMSMFSGLYPLAFSLLTRVSRFSSWSMIVAFKTATHSSSYSATSLSRYFRSQLMSSLNS